MPKVPLKPGPEEIRGPSGLRRRIDRGRVAALAQFIVGRREAARS
jgi:hypothetical protein